MFNKLKASLGIGGAKVDTILDNPSLYQGDTLKGVVRILGGNAEQKIDAIRLVLCTSVKVENEDQISFETHVLAEHEADESFVIKAGETQDIPFEIELNPETPITSLATQNNQSQIWLETILDLDFAVDANDRDYIEVLPLAPVNTILHIMQKEGFQLVKADVEKGFLQGDGFQTYSGCYQELEFKNDSFFNGREIELSFVVDDNAIHCLSEIDRRHGDGDTYRSFSLSRHASEEEILDALKETLLA